MMGALFSTNIVGLSTRACKNANAECLTSDIENYVVLENHCSESYEEIIKKRLTSTKDVVINYVAEFTIAQLFNALRNSAKLKKYVARFWIEIHPAILLGLVSCFIALFFGYVYLILHMLYS